MVGGLGFVCEPATCKTQCACATFLCVTFRPNSVAVTQPACPALLSPLPSTGLGFVTFAPWSERLGNSRDISVCCILGRVTHRGFLFMKSGKGVHCVLLMELKL